MLAYRLEIELLGGDAFLQIFVLTVTDILNQGVSVFGDQ
jgi:hypothetical protein